MSLKIILVNPSWGTKYPQPPLGLASLAAVLETNGYSVEIIDANALQLSEQDAIMLVKGADVVGITAMTPIINSAIKTAKGIKHANPNTTIILGGPHATIYSKDILKNIPEIDVIVKGEGEDTIVELCWGLENNSLDGIYGITYRKGNQVIENPPRPQITDLDTLPFLAYHLLPIDKYKLHPPHGRKSPLMAMLTSRGCPYNCIFCSKSVFGSTWRGQSPKRTVDEIEHLRDKFHVREIAFYDDSFTLKSKRVFQFTEELKKRDIDIIWTCETRVNLINEEMLKAMKNAGCYMIAYGIESGNQSILSTLRKNITTEQVRFAVETTQKVGIQTVGYFMIGSPGETTASIRQTINFAKSLPLDFAQFSVTIPFPGSDLYDIFFSKIDKDFCWDDFIYARTDSFAPPVFETTELSKDDLRNWNAAAYSEFYLRASYIWNRFIGMRSLGDLKANLTGLQLFFEMRGKKQ